MRNNGRKRKGELRMKMRRRRSRRKRKHTSESWLGSGFLVLASPQ
jgi:hypothetical protein